MPQNPMLPCSISAAYGTQPGWRDLLPSSRAQLNFSSCIWNEKQIEKLNYITCLFNTF